MKLIRLTLILALLAAAGCTAALPQDYPRQPSTALANPEATALGKKFAPLEQANPGKSGFYLLHSGIEAFSTILLLTEAAQQTIDIQYYIYRFDITGQMLAKSLLEAADRGVRVRLLLDDFEIEGNDFRFAVMASHPHIEVRFFNPFAGRNGFGRTWSMLLAFRQINQRMHNKIFAVDNQLAMVGGRNIADAYFSVELNQFFADLDLLATGPVVREASATFDEFWNAELAVPVEALVMSQPTPQDLIELRQELEVVWNQEEAQEYQQRLQASGFDRQFRENSLRWLWGAAKVVYDKVEQVTSNGPQKDQMTLLGAYLRPHLQSTDQEYVVISPYLIPGENGMALFRKLRQRGVNVRILTNSLAATDVAVVYGAYADYRKALLEMGIELYELKPGSASERDKDDDHASSIGSTLHAKTMVFDRSEVFVGSMNLDPRSIHLNTELGLVVTSPPLARQVLDLFDRMTSPETSLKLTLEEGRLVWSTRENGIERRYYRSPYVSIWTIIWSDLSELLIPNSLL